MLQSGTYGQVRELQVGRSVQALAWSVLPSLTSFSHVLVCGGARIDADRRSWRELLLVALAERARHALAVLDDAIQSILPGVLSPWSSVGVSDSLFRNLH